MLDVVNSLAEPTCIMFPDEPFRVSPFPWRSAYNLPVALIANQLWIVGPDAPKNLSDSARLGTLDLHECAMEPPESTDSDRFFLLPVLRMAGVEDSWADSLKALIGEAEVGWMLAMPHETEPRFQSHYGYPRPRSVNLWPEVMDFDAVVARAFAGRIVTAGHAKRSAQLRSIVTASVPPQHREPDKPCPRCTILWCTDCPFLASLQAQA